MEPSIVIFISWWFVFEHPPTRLYVDLNLLACPQTAMLISALGILPHVFRVLSVNTKAFFFSWIATLGAQSFRILFGRGNRATGGAWRRCAFFASCNYPKSWLPHLAPMSGGQRRVPPTNIQRNIVCERGRVSQRRLMETISPNTKRTALRSRLLVGTLEATCFRFQQLQ